MKTKNIIFLILGIVLTIALAISGWIYFNYRNDKSVDSQIDQSKVSFTPIPKVTTTTVPVISGSFVTPTQTEDAYSP